MIISTPLSTKPHTNTTPCFARSDRTSSEIAPAAARTKYASSCCFRDSIARSDTEWHFTQPRTPQSQRLVAYVHFPLSQWHARTLGDTAYSVASHRMRPGCEPGLE